MVSEVEDSFPFSVNFKFKCGPHVFLYSGKRMDIACSTIVYCHDGIQVFHHYPLVHFRNWWVYDSLTGLCFAI